MKTLRAPQTARPEPDEFIFEPADRLEPISVTCPSCRAGLLIDSDADLSYRASHIGYANETTFGLYATCPHDGAGIRVEEYREPGNPARQDPTRSWNPKIPLQLRSAAYRAWENDPTKTRVYWQWFFGLGEITSWARSNVRAHRKWKARLCPDYTLEALRAAGFSDEDLVLVNASLFTGLIRHLDRFDGSLAELIADCRDRADSMRALDGPARRKAMNAARKYQPLDL